ncbi:metallophosphoesterase, partial [Candidatus Woesearchaeota archaeon]|nr:metallophosphoesterase [Candidatus Woesearchaeota archaeon]
MIPSNIQLLDLGLCIGDALVLSDIHLGYEEAQNKRGILMPRVGFKALLDRLTAMCTGKHFSSIILNGDIKHEFGSISPSEWKTILRFLDFLGQYTTRIVMVEGNHDPLLHYVATKRSIPVVDHVLLGDVYVTHGDRIPDNTDFVQAKVLVIGHDHPAVTLSQGARRETYKCFLIGLWKKKNLIVMPSCNLLTEGSDILTSKPLSPFLKNTDDFEVYIA